MGIGDDQEAVLSVRILTPTGGQQSDDSGLSAAERLDARIRLERGKGIVGFAHPSDPNQVLVFFARVRATSYHTNELANFWIAWDATGKQVETKPNGNRLDIIRRASAEFGTNTVMIQVGGVLGEDEITALRRVTVKKFE